MSLINWISVDDKLPIFDRNCFITDSVMGPGNPISITTGFLSESGWKNYCNDEHHYAHAITHWAYVTEEHPVASSKDDNKIINNVKAVVPEASPVIPNINPVMKSESFAYWLNGFAELTTEPPTKEQWRVIKEHLSLVFNKVTSPINTDTPGTVQEALEKYKQTPINLDTWRWPGNIVNPSISNNPKESSKLNIIC